MELMSRCVHGADVVLMRSRFGNERFLYPSSEPIKMILKREEFQECFSLFFRHINLPSFLRC